MPDDLSSYQKQMCGVKNDTMSTSIASVVMQSVGPPLAKTKIWMKYGADFHDPWRMNLMYVVEHLTFPVVLLTFYLIFNNYDIFCV